jgi:hypothetical protein
MHFLSGVAMVTYQALCRNPENFVYGIDTRCCDLLMLKASDYFSIRPEMATEKQEVTYNGLYREDSGKKY